MCEAPSIIQSGKTHSCVYYNSLVITANISSLGSSCNLCIVLKLISRSVKIYEEADNKSSHKLSRKMPNTHSYTRVYCEFYERAITHIKLLLYIHSWGKCFCVFLRTGAGSVGASVNARHVLDFTFCSHHFSPQCVCFTSNCTILVPYTSSWSSCRSAALTSFNRLVIFYEPVTA